MSQIMPNMGALLSAYFSAAIRRSAVVAASFRVA
jgi:hypothetical protein